MKTIEENFRDWEGDTFGFGYGTGEPYTIPALKAFLELCSDGPYNHSYDYRKLEAKLSPTVAWLLINILCSYKVDIIEYGVSPRFGWLSRRGEKLKEFVANRTEQELVDIVCDYDPQDYVTCSRGACNCGPNGYEEGKECPNPFWEPDAWRRNVASS